MLETSARLLKLLTLLQSRRHWTGAALSERLEIDRRTVRRDVDKLRALGYPVHASSGLGGGYELGQGSRVPPVLLSDDEAVVVAVALRAATGSIGGMEETAAQVLAKLEQLLPTRLTKRVGALDAVMSTLPTEGPRAPAETLAVLAGACRDAEAVALDYCDRHRHQTRRTLEPLHLVHAVRCWYLVAWDLGRAGWRTLRVDRISAPRRTGQRFVPRQLPEPLSTFVAHALTRAPQRYQLRLRLHGSVGALAKKVPRWAGLLEPESDTTSWLHVAADSMEHLAACLLTCGAPFELDGAPPYLAELRRTLERVQRQLGGAGPGR